MTPVVEIDHVTRRYRGSTALDDVSTVLQEGTITGLLGRNGAGKSTLMRIITGQEFVSSGTVRVGGQNPLENDAVLRRMIFVKESQIYPDIKVKRALEAASWFYPNWDAECAGQLMDDFALPGNRSIKKLSRGMHSAVGIVIGVAGALAMSRALSALLFGISATDPITFVLAAVALAVAALAAAYAPARRAGRIDPVVLLR